MQQKAYDGLVIAEDLRKIDFTSKGHRGNIPKRILFIPTEDPEMDDLEFGDITQNGDINVYSISNNGDRDMILATLIDAIGRYTQLYPDRWIHFSGSTEGRTRMCRMAISRNLEEHSRSFDICVNANGGLIPFQRNMDVYDFYIRRKALKIAV
jgi:hypothetical protein